MAKVKRRRDRTRVSKGSPRGRVLKTQLFIDTYTKWLKRQTVKLVEAKTEVKVPADAYEEWIREQVKKQGATGVTLKAS